MCCAALSDSLPPNDPSTASAASMRTTRAVRGSMLRKSPGSARRASSAIWPAISTPVGPAPTTAKVSRRSTWSGSSDSSASSNAPKIRPRSSRASSMLFRPGACSAKASLPKYDWVDPAETTRLSYGRRPCVPSALSEVTVRAARSIAVTSPSTTRAFFCRRSTSRVAGAISPSDRIPVATWYSSGWNRWWVVRAIIVTSTSARLSGRVANRPAEAGADDHHAVPAAARTRPVLPHGSPPSRPGRAAAGRASLVRGDRSARLLSRPSQPGPVVVPVTAAGQAVRRTRPATEVPA